MLVVQIHGIAEAPVFVVAGTAAGWELADAVGQETLAALQVDPVRQRYQALVHRSPQQTLYQYCFLL